MAEQDHIYLHTDASNRWSSTLHYQKTMSVTLLGKEGVTRVDYVEEGTLDVALKDLSLDRSLG